MENPKRFDEIRSWRDEEIAGVFEQLIQDEQFLGLFPVAFPNVPKEKVINLLQNLHSVDEAQMQIIIPFVDNLVKKTLTDYRVEGLETLDADKQYLFISNHRDIILDPALFNVYRRLHGLPTTEIAIGNNLFVKSWVETFVRVNRAFVVKRNLPPRELLEASALLSAYIRELIDNNLRSVWIAQREGRAKDSDDRTQLALLKMLAMSGSGSIADSLRQLHIVPMSISYEYDPCDYLKAQEFQLKRDNPDYRKMPQDDAINMLTGLTGWKGQVRFIVDGGINEELSALADTEGKNAQTADAAWLIDRRIHRNYRIYPCNEVALTLLGGGDVSFVRTYTDADRKAFEIYLQGQLDKIQIPNKDEDFLRTKILQMYANPLINKIKAIAPPKSPQGGTWLTY